MPSIKKLNDLIWLVYKKKQLILFPPPRQFMVGSNYAGGAGKLKETISISRFASSGNSIAIVKEQETVEVFADRDDVIS